MAKVRSIRQLRLPLGVNRLPAAAVRDLLKTSARQPRRSKYGAVRTDAEGKTFDSRREATRYIDLRRLEDAGEITNLECQKAFPLIVKGVKVGTYVSDFCYIDRDGKAVVEDVKSRPTRTALYVLKRKLVGALYGVKIIEIM